MSKEFAIAAINNLPDQFDLDLLFERLIFVEKVEQGLKQLEFKNTVSHAEVINQIKTWHRSPGYER